MSIITDFVAEVNSIPAVAVAMAGRVYPVADTGGQLPSLVYNTRGGYKESYIKDSFGLRETFVQLDVYTESYAELDTIRDAILEHLNGFTGNFNTNGATVSSCKAVNTRELPDGQNNKIYRSILEFNILSN